MLGDVSLAGGRRTPLQEWIRTGRRERDSRATASASSAPKISRENISAAICLRPCAVARQHRGALDRLQRTRGLHATRFERRAIQSAARDSENRNKGAARLAGAAAATGTFHPPGNGEDRR